MALVGTTSAEAAAAGVKPEGRIVRRRAVEEGVNEGRRGTRVVKVLMKSTLAKALRKGSKGVHTWGIE